MSGTGENLCRLQSVHTLAPMSTQALIKVVPWIYVLDEKRSGVQVATHLHLMQKYEYLDSQSTHLMP